MNREIGHEEAWASLDAAAHTGHAAAPALRDG